MNQVRHGDVFLQRVSDIPTEAKPYKSDILAEGEATGHAHRLVGKIAENESFSLFTTDDGRLWIRITAPTTLTHQEHGPVSLPCGCYVCGIGPEGKLGRVQREWAPEGPRNVTD